MIPGSNAVISRLCAVFGSQFRCFFQQDGFVFPKQDLAENDSTSGLHNIISFSCFACMKMETADRSVLLISLWSDGIRSGDAQSDDAQSDDAQSGNVRSDDVRSDDARSDDARSDDARNDDARSDDARSDDARSDDPLPRALVQYLSQ